MKQPEERRADLLQQQPDQVFQYKQPGRTLSLHRPPEAKQHFLQEDNENQKSG